MNAVGKQHRGISRLLACLIGACALLGISAASASAGVQWRIASTHGPTVMAPGDADPSTVEGQYMIQAFNIGDEASTEGTTITDTLPAGITAVETGGRGWECPGAEGSSEVICTREGTVNPEGPSIFNASAAPALFISVSVAPGASGTSPNTASISGGGAEPCGGAEPPCPTAVDQTTFGTTPAPFGITPGSYAADLFDARFPAGSPVRQAGSHPYELRVDFGLNLKLSSNPNPNPVGEPRYYTEPVGLLHTLENTLPPGLIGNPAAAPICPGYLLTDPGKAQHGRCPVASQVGTIDLVVQNGMTVQTAGNINPMTRIPVYNVNPPNDGVAAFAFSVLGNAIYIIASLDPSDYSVRTRIVQSNTLLPLRSAQLRLWGVPADPSHDSLRSNPNALGLGDAYEAQSTAPITPFLTLPSQCEGSGSIRQRVSSWADPAAFTPTESGATIQATGCDDPRFRFKPTISIQPTSHEAASPTGLDIDLNVPQKDDSFPSADPETNAANAAKLYAQSGNDAAIVTPNLKDAVTHLPLGMAVNPSVAGGLTGCSRAEVGLGTNDDPACPDASKIGSVEIESPLVRDTLKGSVYQAKQSENPFGSLLGFYTVAQGNGLTIKLAAKVDADPETGQLTTTFTDSPQLAFSHYRLHFNGGQRAPLVNPPLCGTHSATARFTAWNSSVPVVDTGDQMQITSGPNGKPCPSGLAGRPFSPGFDAKSLTPIAGAFSPFAVDVSRQDGEQELRSIQTTLPPGMIGKLAGIPYCSDAALASISSAPGTGLAQRLNPSCPAASLVGHTDAAAGAGALPFHNPGNVYLAGPYKGAPLSLAIVTPIVAGPLDLGSIVVRAAAYVDPVTTQIRVISDPIPDKIVADGNGFPLNLRSVRVSMDRDRFTLNPTSCAAMSVDGTIGSLQGASVAVKDRFQVGACKALDFKPSLSLKVKGATRRGAYPALRAELKAKPGEANIAKVSVALPHSEFLAQEHIKTICTRVQYAAEACPAGSIYGRARAFSPLLDQPLEGPVYLRSSSNPLPDLVVALHGQIDVDLAGRIDSVGGGIRNTFNLVPDAPVSKFVLEMKGGKKGLLVNSRNLCKSTNRATVKMDGQNGKVHDFRPALKTSCGAKSGKGK